MPSKLEKTLHRLLTERLEQFGFTPIECLSFTRNVDGCNQSINVPSRKEGDRLKFTCILGIQFDELEALITPNNVGWDSSMGSPIHLLAPERRYYEWEGGNEEELTIAADSMIAELHEVGFDYFDRFSTLEAIEEELTLHPVSNWFVLSAHQRTGILATCAVLRGERSVAENLFAEAFKDPRYKHPGRRRRLEELRQRVLGK